MIQLARQLTVIASLVLAMLLSGCGGEKTNIQGTAGSQVQSCSSLLGVTCVSGRLIDDAASNVDYECGLSGGGTVRSVTAIDGGFTCPNGSVVTFFLGNPASTNVDDRILLGQVTVERPAMIYGDSPTIPVYFYVTPRMLAGDGGGGGFSVRAINIARLLQTLSTDTTDADQSGYLPTRRVIISDTDKLQILASRFPNGLDFGQPAATDPSNPPTGTFDYSIKTYLQSLPESSRQQLVSSTIAITALGKGNNSTTAGMYLVPGGSVLSTGSLDPVNQTLSADTGAMVGTDFGNAKQFVGSLYVLADRRGRTIGHGIYSYGTPVAPDPWQVWSDPQPMQLTETGNSYSSMPVWPIDNSLKQFRFALLGSNDTGSYVNLTQGNIIRQAVAGSSTSYTNLFQESSTPDVLGTWSLEQGTNTYISNGAYTLEHTVSVAPLMNPDLWNSSVVTFPLPITVTLWNQDYTNSACTRGCRVADIRMTILQDGNIISDRFDDCGANVDPQSLVYNNDPSKQEIPLGVVANILNTLLDEGTTPLKTMTLLAMLPNDTRLNDSMVVQTGFESYVPYVQFGSNLGENSLLRVDGNVNKFQTYGYCSNDFAQLGLCAYPNTFQPGVATWLNGLTFMKAIKANKVAPTDPATQALSVNIGGTMTAAPRTCP
ncbi:MAG TPA: hypothetical protein VFM34_00265 [Moraxellaceae bacterium]|nr:hypothetical protein [Moraxellaceae bacterium]